MFKSYIDDHMEAYIQLILQLSAIPAPSHHEEKRSAFILTQLRKMGYDQTYIDEAGSVICDLRPEDQEDQVLMYMAHMDVVFSDMDTLPVQMTEDRIYGPGVGDDTVNVCAMLMALGFYAEKGLKDPAEPHRVFVFDVCEEGLGNLKGARAAVAAYTDRIAHMTAFDLGYDAIYAGAVGSRRYEITIRTEGGHSWNDFGRANAIEKCAALICALYGQDSPKEDKRQDAAGANVPEMGGNGCDIKTSYNVGTICGGTSVNTIAQAASFTYEFRANREAGLDLMENRFREILAAQTRGLDVSCRLIGARPSMSRVDEKRMQRLTMHAEETIMKHTGIQPVVKEGSTDCNIPLSMGIPAICFGAYLGKGEHTRQEYVTLASLKPGLRALIAYIIEDF